MDTTKESISMCEKAVEIQKFRNKKINTGDFYYQRLGRGQDSEGKVSISKIGIQTHPVPNPTADRVWLPRQDQLQKIYLDNRKHKINCGQMSMFFEDWRHDELMRYGRDLWDWSMEQLWLAFVMKIKYNKIWNGKEWEVK